MNQKEVIELIKNNLRCESDSYDTYSAQLSVILEKYENKTWKSYCLNSNNVNYVSDMKMQDCLIKWLDKDDYNFYQTMKMIYFSPLTLWYLHNKNKNKNKFNPQR